VFGILIIWGSIDGADDRVADGMSEMVGLVDGAKDNVGFKEGGEDDVGLDEMDGLVDGDEVGD